MDLDRKQACWIYCNLIEDMSDLGIGSYYGMDDRRTKLHDELCKLFGLDKSITNKHTDNLDKIKFNGTKLYLALLKERNASQKHL